MELELWKKNKKNTIKYTNFTKINLYDLLILVISTLRRV